MIRASQLTYHAQTIPQTSFLSHDVHLIKKNVNKYTIKTQIQILTYTLAKRSILMLSFLQKPHFYLKRVQFMNTFYTNIQLLIKQFANFSQSHFRFQLFQYFILNVSNFNDCDNYAGFLWLCSVNRSI